MLQDPNVERYVENAIKPLKKEIAKLKVQIEELNKALRIHDVNGMLCGSFDPDNKTSSATKCKCGREKWEHPKPRN